MKYKDRLVGYFKDIAEVALQGDAREESFYPSLERFLEHLSVDLGKVGIHVTTLPKKTEGGNPDFRVWNGSDRIIGYVEAKRPGESDLDQIETSEQLQRYLHTFPNLILTDFFEFRLYRNGQLVDRVLAARPFVLQQLKITPPVEKADALVSLLDRFFGFAVPKAQNAEILAMELAKRTRFLRDIVAEELRENQANKVMQSPLLGFYEAFKKYLIADLTLEDFADLYAQTITYGLFAARTRASNGFNRRIAYEKIPRTIGILRDIFLFISLGDLPPQLEWIVDDISEVLAVADASGILARYYHEGKGSDPIVHFYETFLSAYDPEERERRGVYYTPEPVVSYIVRSLHHLLKENLNFSDGLASPEVTLLDPAAGTMTFVARACQEAVREFGSKYGSGGREEFISQQILKNYYAFELMMAPYAVGHLKMSFFLDELGHRLGDRERFQFYLTNSLEMEELEQTSLPGMSSLAQESHLAGEVKKRRPILVILGNPPYSGHSSNRGEWIRKIIDDYKRVNGRPLGEKNPKWLQDDYVKFLRFAQWKITQTGQGLVGMITNHSYLDNPTFRGMRLSLMRTYDEIYVLDLHGNSLKRETSPDGSKDENVFDIQQGVAIAFFIKRSTEKVIKSRPSIPSPQSSNGKGIVYHADLWGKREAKYDWLQNHDVTTTSWQEIHPKQEFYLFVPRDEARQERYNKFAKVTELFPLKSVGIVTARDKLTIHWTPEEVWTTTLNFSQLDPELARQAYDLGKDARDWKVILAQEDLKKSGLDRGKIVTILYRPFDIRYTYYTGRSRGFICMPRLEVMRHMLAGENLALMTCRQLSQLEWYHAMVSDRITDDCMVSNRTRERGYLLPLYVLPAKSERNLFSYIETAQKRKPNLNPTIISRLELQWGAKFQTHLKSVDDPPSQMDFPPHLPSPSPQAERGRGGEVKWRTPPHLWEKLKPLAREMRREPTPEEDILWQRLRNRNVLGFKFRRQHTIDRFILDFYCSEASLVIEVEGAIHQYTPKQDAIRREYLETLGLRVLRFTNDDINSDLESALEKIAASLSEEGRTFTPEDIFHYVYAILYAPSYRTNYVEFLKTDFPRIPFTADFEVFRTLAGFGKRLVDLHLLHSTELEQPLARFQGRGDNRVARGKRDGVRHAPEGQRLYINKTQFFEPVPQEVWEYQIGGYQVLEKWLKDRQDRRLSLEEIKIYCRVVTALKATLILHDEIDAIYMKAEEHIIDLEDQS